jgi:LacI family transcriptional regulator
MAATDRIGLDVSRACRLIGRRIPDEVALMGVDNELEICRLVDPPLTSIDHGSRRIGYEAARVLDEWLTTGRRPTTVTVEPIEVVPRQSTDLLAINEPDVVAALRFIRSRFSDVIKVKDVLRHVAMSRRSLEMHFKTLLGRTIHDEILRVRIEHAKHLLLTSEWSMPYIADECGFALASQFSFVFRRETGETPVAFRKRQRGGIKAE